MHNHISIEARNNNIYPSGWPTANSSSQTRLVNDGPTLNRETSQEINAIFRYAPQRNQNQGPRQFGNMPPPQNQQASVPQGGNQQIQNQPPRQYNAVAPPQMYHPDPSNSKNRAPRPQKKGPRRDNYYPLPGSFVTAITILMGPVATREEDCTVSRVGFY